MNILCQAFAFLRIKSVFLRDWDSLTYSNIYAKWIPFNLCWGETYLEPPLKKLMAFAKWKITIGCIQSVH